MRKLLKLLPAAAVLAGLVWLAWPRGEAAPDETLLVVSPHWEGIRDEFGRAFAEHWKAATGRTVRVAFMDMSGTSKCVQHIRSRPPGEEPVADVFFGGGADNHAGLAAAGYLEPVELPAGDLAELPGELCGCPLRDPQNRWFAACLSSFGICFNREVLRRRGLPEPKEWEDLAAGAFVGQVGSGDPRSSGAVHMCYEMILQSYGWEKGFALITRMAGNVRTFDESGGGVPREVALGQFAAGGTIDFYALEQVIRLGADSMGYAVPQRLPVITGDPVSAIRGTPRRELAAEFVRFAMSETGQKLWYLPPGAPGGPQRFALGRLPARRALCADAAARLGLADPFAARGSGGWDSARSGRRWALLNELLGAMIIDPHHELRRAWSALLESGMPGPEAELFGAPPCSEEEFMRLADWYNDRSVGAAAKNALRAEWARQARERYERIAAGCHVRT